MCPDSLDPVDGILDLAHLSPEAELWAKRDRVRMALRNVEIPFDVPLPLPSPLRLGARARIRLHPDERGRLLMHKRRSHEDVTPDLASMARPEVVEAVRLLEEQLMRDPRRIRGLESLEFRSDGRKIVVVATPDPRLRMEPRHLDFLAPPPGGALALGRRPVHGDPWIEIACGGVGLRFGPLTFYQVNLEVNRTMVDRIADLVQAWKPARLADLFGGAGNLSLGLAHRGIPLTLIEAYPPAVADARKNIRRHGLTVDLREQDAWRCQPGDFFADVVILDPPRAGAGELIPRLCLTSPRAVLLVSCNPVAMARDVRAAIRSGYKVESMDLFDLFPLTSHVETLVTLTR